MLPISLGLMTIRLAHPLNAALFDTFEAWIGSETAPNVLSADLPEPAFDKTGRTRNSVWRGVIIHLKKDAVVNAANSQMLGRLIPFHR
jgi:hypothetical protein